MLIRCESCGKLFDFDKAEGLCPACGHFHTQPPVAAAPNAESEPQRTESTGRVVGTGRESASAGRSPQRILALVLLAIWVLILVGGFGLHLLQKQRWKSSGKLSDVEVQTVSAQDVVLHNQHYSFGPYQKMTTRTAGLPEGYVLVQVQVDRKEAIEWVREREDTCYLQVESANGLSYYAPLESYAIERVYPDLSANYMDAYDLSSIEPGVGYMYFAVPADFTSAAMYLEEATRIKYESPRHVKNLWVCPLEEDTAPPAPAPTEDGSSSTDASSADSLPDELAALADLEVDLDV